MMNRNLYDNYTRTQALVAGTDEEAMLSWSARYFQSNYLRLLPQDREAAILEVGCGYGRYIKALLALGYRNCCGIDTSADQVEYARKGLKIANIEQADAISWLEGKANAFDLILAMDVLEHMDMAYLLEFGKMACNALKPGGQLIVQVPNGLSPMNPIVHGDLTHLRAFTPQSIRQFFLLSGLHPGIIGEIPPLANGPMGIVRRGLWLLAIKPLLAMFMRAVHGRIMIRDIYTANLLAVARKP